MILSKISTRLLLAVGVCFGLTRLPVPETPLRRPLDPIASLAATIQWVRADTAFDQRRLEIGLARAWRALELDPDATEGWSWLASRLVHTFGSPEFEASSTARRTWVEAGLAVLAYGEGDEKHERAAEPEELAFHAGIVMSFVAMLPEEVLEWPGGARAAWEAAAGHFERAEALGHPQAGDVAKAARLEIQSLAPAEEGS